jgi:hypothetical protein
MISKNGSHKAPIVLALINATVLFCLGAQSIRGAKTEVQSIVRARAIELVDDNGNVRASINVAENGEAVFRLRDSKGVIRVKMGASEQGSALLLLDEATNPALHVLARDKTTMSLKSRDGQMHEISP